MRARRLPTYLLASLGALPVLVWWLGWNPGFASTDTIDQWEQLTSNNYLSHHPPIHTFYLDLLSLNGRAPGVVTLFQLLVFGLLLAYAAKHLVRAGVPSWVAIGVAWVLGLSPAVAPTTLALWKDVPFALALLWAWIELLALAAEPAPSRKSWRLARLGIALGAVWVFRGNGPLTVLPLLVVLAWSWRKQWRAWALMTGVTTAVVVLVIGPLYSMLHVSGSPIEPAQVFLPDVAASYRDDPSAFTAMDISLLTAVAPLNIWENRYDCDDSTPLLFDVEFDQTAVREFPGEYRSLEGRVLLRDFSGVLGHRLCAASFLYLPAQPDDAYFHRPPYEIPANEVGLTRKPISDLAFEVTDRFWRWAEVDGRLWLTWRPAILVLPALAAVVVFAIRRGARRFLIPSALLVAHLLNVAVTSPAQEFRYAFPLYLMSAFTITLLIPAFRGTATIRERGEARAVGVD